MANSALPNTSANTIKPIEIALTARYRPTLLCMMPPSQKIVVAVK